MSASEPRVYTIANRLYQGLPAEKKNETTGEIEVITFAARGEPGFEQELSEDEMTPQIFALIQNGMLRIVGEQVGKSRAGVLNYKGEIYTSDGFPAADSVQLGWLYAVKASVTDNNGAKTNTGQSFVAGEEIFWNGSAWVSNYESGAGGGASVLNDLTDVNAGSPSSGDALVWDGSEWVPAAVGSGAGGLSYQGTWNAATNTPDLSAASPSNGQYWVVDIAGTTDVDGITDWGVSDWAIFNGTNFQKIDNSEPAIPPAGASMEFFDVDLGQAAGSEFSNLPSGWAATYDGGAGSISVNHAQTGKVPAVLSAVNFDAVGSGFLSNCPLRLPSNSDNILVEIPKNGTNDGVQTIFEIKGTGLSLLGQKFRVFVSLMDSGF